MEGPRGGLVTAVARGSLGEALGLAPGDRIITVNGRPLADLIDYLQEIDGEEVLLEVERAGGERVEFEVEKDPAEGLGVEFAQAVFDGVRRCHNRCVFCFVDQLPPGLRPSLYLKDDDYRLSFCQGNYITLTNLSEADVDRILRLRLSPLYVSVHATDPAVRRALLRHPRAGRESLDLLHRLVNGGIQVHAQLVLCPGWNDGEVLARTLEELGRLEGIRSIAAVPVGVSRFRRDPVPLRSYRPEEARAVIAAVQRWQARFFARRGTRLVFLADEFYLRAGEPLPPASAYEDFAQLEDGVGMVRKFWEEAEEALPAAGRCDGEGVHVVTGVAGAKVIHPLLQGLQRRGRARPARLLVVPNRFFGAGEVTVTGLLTGADIAFAVQAARRRGEEVRRLLVADAVFRSGKGVTLDDQTPEELSGRCGAAVEVVPADGGALVRRLCG
ncbi:MAG: DUF512 domain-containing protein [Bacillota bacterium]|nr:DUF512 domain-containing protein [Bacillota bacterium]